MRRLPCQGSYSQNRKNSQVTKIVSQEKDKYLSKASLDKLKFLFPNIDLENDFDLLPVAFNAAVINKNNKNGDLISVDPDGGPYICVNRVITIDKKDYIVTNINKYEKK